MKVVEVVVAYVAEDKRQFCKDGHPIGKPWPFGKIGRMKAQIDRLVARHGVPKSKARELVRREQTLVAYHQARRLTIS